MKNIYNGLKMKTSLYRVIYVSQLLGDHSRLAFVSNAPLFLLHPLQQTFSHFAAHIAWIHYSASCARRHRVDIIIFTIILAICIVVVIIIVNVSKR